MRSQTEDLGRVMAGTPAEPDSGSPGQAPEDRLDSWKEIAAYLQRTDRTVQRWEQTEGLPIHRHAHEKGGSVYAYKSELDAWLASRRNGLEPGFGAASLSPLALAVQRYRRLAFVAAFVLVLPAILAVGLYQWLASRHEPFREFQMTPLVTTGKPRRAAISPNGSYVVYSVSDAGKESLWLRQVATGADVQIVPPAEVTYTGVAFSPSGEFIYFVSSESDVADRFTVLYPPGTLYRVPVVGGTPAKVLSDAGDSITFSPDGSQLAFVRTFPTGESAIMAARSGGAGERKLAVRRLPQAYEERPAWSPDGKVIACGVVTYDSRAPRAGVVAVPAEGGAERQITSAGWFAVGPVAWLAEGRGLLVIARNRLDTPAQIWHVSYPGGKARRITQDLKHYFGVSLSADSRLLVTVQSDVRSAVWVASAGNDSLPQEIASSTLAQDFSRGLSWTPDGRIVYVSGASGNPQIWVMSADGSNPTQLTNGDDSNIFPQVSPDGRHIVFVSDRTGAPHIWMMGMDGSDPMQLTSGTDESGPEFSPDAKWVIYTATNSGVQTLWKIPVQGGSAVRLADTYAYSPAVSPDGRLIAYSGRDEKTTGKPEVAILPFAGGRPQRSFPIASFRVRWSPDGKALLYLRTQARLSNIWRQPIAVGLPERVTDFKTGYIFDFAYSHDGQRLALSRGTWDADLVLLRDAK